MTLRSGSIYRNSWVWHLEHQFIILDVDDIYKIPLLRSTCFQGYFDVLGDTHPVSNSNAGHKSNISTGF